MSHHAETTSLDAATAADIFHRLPEEDQVAIRAERLDLERELGRRISPLAHFEMMLGNGWGGPGWGGDRPADIAWGHAGELWRALPVERDTDEFESELDARDAVETLVAPALIELPLERPHRGRKGHDDRRHLMLMRELLRTRKDIRSPWAAAKTIVGPDDKDAIERLTRKYANWEADGFPTEWVAVKD